MFRSLDGELIPLTDEEIAARQAEEAEALAYVRPVNAITPLQARKALRQLGYKAAVDAYISTLSEEDQEEWEFATVIMRDNPIIAAGQFALELTDEQVDNLFLVGATL